MCGQGLQGFRRRRRRPRHQLRTRVRLRASRDRRTAAGTGPHPEGLGRPVRLVPIPPDESVVLSVQQMGTAGVTHTIGSLDMAAKVRSNPLHDEVQTGWSGTSDKASPVNAVACQLRPGRPTRGAATV
jgi:hypothetical protein